MIHGIFIFYLRRDFFCRQKTFFFGPNNFFIQSCTECARDCGPYEVKNVSRETQKHTGKVKYACRETQMQCCQWAGALNFCKYSGSDKANKAKEAFKIISSIFLRMRVTIPGTQGTMILFQLLLSRESYSKIRKALENDKFNFVIITEHYFSSGFHNKKVSV